MISFKKTTFLIAILASFFSCVENLDFTQIEDFKITPEYEFSFFYFTFTENEIMTSNIEDVFEANFFENDIIRDNIQKIDFEVQASNQLDRDINIEIDFLDENENILFELQDLIIEKNNINFNNVEEIIIDTNQNIKQTKKLKILIKAEDSLGTISSNDMSMFEFKSAVKIYIEKEF